AATTSDARRSRGASGPPPPHRLRASSVTQTGTTATATATPAASTTSPESNPASPASVVGRSPALPPATFIFEAQGRPESPPPPFAFGGFGPDPNGGGLIVQGKPPRSRNRMPSDKLDGARREKEAICKDLDIDLKTITIWFQNKRQTVARTRKQQLAFDGSEGGSATYPAAMDVLASASATMSPLAATSAEAPSATVASATARMGSGAAGSSCSEGSPLDRTTTSRLKSAARSPPPCGAVSQRQTPRVLPLSASAAHDPNVFERRRADVSSSTPFSSPSPDLPRRTRLGCSWPPIIHPEDLWKHIPSSPAQSALSSSPDVSPDVGTPCRSSRSSAQRPRTLEWACARSAKRRRTNPHLMHDVDEEADECGSVDRSASGTRVPLEYYDKFPLDIVHGAVLLLGLRDAAHRLGI
ncbi:hypothetical protein F5148DRAFT_1162247, partial [Russula earlei]